nr:hypothetical protein [Bacilli bacterium]
MFSKTDANLKKGQARDKNGGMSRFQVDLHFDNLLKTLNKRIEKVNVDLQAAIDAWKQAKQSNVKAEVLRCRDKVSRLLSVKLRKEKYID